MDQNKGETNCIFCFCANQHDTVANGKFILPYSSNLIADVRSSILFPNLSVQTPRTKTDDD